MARDYTYPNIPMEMPVVRELLGAYRSPNNKISSMERSGELIRLRRGLYIASSASGTREVSRELIANNLYGPSYVSCESALSYHRLNPERVNAVVSSTFKRAKSYSTPLGEFEYITVPEDYYSIAIEQVLVGDEYAFLIATPEKALCDLIISTSGLRFQSARAAREYILYDLRIDLSERPVWDIDIVAACAQHRRKSRELNFLLEVLQNG